MDVKKGEIIVKQDDPGDCMFVLVDGGARVVHHSGGRDIDLAALKPGDFFGELALVDDGLRSADVQALSDCALLRITQAVISAVGGRLSHGRRSSFSSPSVASSSAASARRTSATSIRSSFPRTGRTECCGKKGQAVQLRGGCTSSRASAWATSRALPANALRPCEVWAARGRCWGHSAAVRLSSSPRTLSNCAAITTKGEP